MGARDLCVFLKLMPIYDTTAIASIAKQYEKR